MPLFALAVVKLLLPIPILRRAITRVLMAIGENWVSTNCVLMRVAGSVQLESRGLDGLRRDGWYLVIANHQTWVDIVILQAVFNRRVPFLKFFIKQELIWFPLLGIAWWAMDMPFMKRYSKSYLAKYPEKKGMDLEITRQACQKFRETPTSIINFIEGTRFSEEKKARRDSPYTYLLPPRAGGVALALSSMGDMFDAILDVTIIYPGEPPNFWTLSCGEFEHVIIHIEQRPVEKWMVSGDYSNDRDHRRQFHQWLTTLWQEKDAHIDRVKADIGTEAQTGQLP